MIPADKPFIIAETAFHHEGDTSFLFTLMDAAAALHVDAIKFHLLFDLDDYIVSDHQAREVLTKICIPEEAWLEVSRRAASLNLKVIFLCNDVRSLRWVVQLNDPNVIAIEIHATGINDIFLLDEACKFKETVIIGSGGSNIEEIGFAVSFLKERGKEDIFLMHGFQNYPTKYSDVVLGKMDALRKLFNVPVGYADHTDPADSNNEFISCLGLALGYNVLEKHLTTVPGQKRIDSQSAISAEQMQKIIALSEVVWSTRGANPLAMSAGEMKYGDTGPMKKAIVARKPIKAGEVLTPDNIAYKRTNHSTYVKQHQVQLLIGQTASRDIDKDELLDFSKIAFQFKTGDFSQFKIREK